MWPPLEQSSRGPCSWLGTFAVAVLCSVGVQKASSPGEAELLSCRHVWGWSPVASAYGLHPARLHFPWFHRILTCNHKGYTWNYVMLCGFLWDLYFDIRIVLALAPIRGYSVPSYFLEESLKSFYSLNVWYKSSEKWFGSGLWRSFILFCFLISNSLLKAYSYCLFFESGFIVCVLFLPLVYSRFSDCGHAVVIPSWSSQIISVTTVVKSWLCSSFSFVTLAKRLSMSSICWKN